MMKLVGSYERQCLFIGEEKLGVKECRPGQVYVMLRVCTSVNMLLD